MSDPRQSLIKATLSVGHHAMLVTVRSITADGKWALTVDRQNTETRVPMLVQRSKGPLPAVGETWLLDQELGSWTFSAFIGSSPAEFLPEAGGGVPEISVSATAPASPSKNALWINASAGDELLQWNGSQWQPLLIGTQAIADQAVTGQKIADGTITATQIAPDAGITSGQVSFTVSDLGGIPISVGASQPQNPVVGEVWFDPTNGNAMKTWNGSQWVGYQFGTGAIAAGSITAEQIAAGAVIAEKIAAGSITAGALAAGIVVAGIVNGTTIEGAQIVADGTQGELLVYSGTPAKGNLAASVSAAGGTDSATYDNAYLAGFSTYGPYSGGADGLTLAANLAGNSLSWLLSSSASGPYSTMASITAGVLGGGLPALIYNAPNGGSHTFQNGSVVAGSANFGDVALGTSITGALSAGSTGYPSMTDGAGLAQNLSGSQLAQTTGTTVTGTTSVPLGYTSLPANDPETGAIYEIFASGIFSTGSTAPSSATFTVGMGGARVATLAIPGTIGTSLSNAGWFARCRLMWLSATSADVILEVGWHQGFGVGNAVTYFAQATTTGLVSTSSEFLNLHFQWGTAPTGTSLECHAITFARIA